MTAISKDFCPNHIVLCGGIGGAKLALGLTSCLGSEQLMVVGNVGDDFEHWGFKISPDLDTLVYTLSGVSNEELGWGRDGETWTVLEEVSRMGGEAWFRLGDRDLAVHIERSTRLDQGETLSKVTQDLCKAFGLDYCILPPTNDRIRTIVETNIGIMEFQEYFVRNRCEPVVTDLRYEGAKKARLLPDISSALLNPDLQSVIISPSNPFLSIAPILAIPDFQKQLANCRVPRVAVSPMVGARAFKGPTAKIMGELGYEISSFTVASYYSSNLIDGIIIDTDDADLVPRIEKLGIRAYVTDTLMKSFDEKKRLAAEAIQFAKSLGD